MTDLENALYLKFRLAPAKVKRDFASKPAMEGDAGAAALAKLALEAIREQEERNARTERPEAPSVGGWFTEQEPLDPEIARLWDANTDKRMSPNHLCWCL